MSATVFTFLDIHLPNAATWFYFSALLAVALFFKFGRLLSVRNLDVVSLFLPVPGLLLLGEGGAAAFWGYPWLLGAAVYFFVRCLIDLALVRRPALAPNLNLSGLAWLAGALFAGLVAVAMRQPSTPAEHEDAARTPTLGGGQVLQDQLVAAASQRVHDTHLRLWVERGLALVCHLAIVVGLVLVGWRHFEDLHAGMAAATFYLLLPYPFLLMPAAPLGVARWDHAWPMALVVWAVLAYRRPALTGLFLGLAAGTTFFPALLAPVWLSFYWRRGAGRFALAFVLVAGLCLAGLIGLHGLHGGVLPAGQAVADWLPWKPPHSPGFWNHVPGHWAYRMPVFLAYVAFVLTTLFWPAPKNLAHVLALSAATLIGVQFWYAGQGGAYVLWYLPLLLLLMFRPNLSAAQPVVPGDNRLTRLGRRLVQGVRRLLGRPELVPARPNGSP